LLKIQKKSCSKNKNRARLIKQQQIKIINEASDEIEESSFDGASSVFGNISDDLFADEKIDQKSNESFDENLENIQIEMVPKWSLMSVDEQNGIKSLVENWQNSVNTNFNRLAEISSRKKGRRSLVVSFEHAVLGKRGKFNFEKNRTALKLAQLEILQQAKVGLANSRLAIKFLVKMLSGFACLERAKTSRTNSDCQAFWQCLHQSIGSFLKAVLRGAFYVHELANINVSTLFLMPIYLIESDCTNKELFVSLESIRKYILICLNRLNERRTSSTRIKTFKRMFNSLLRVTDVVSAMRDNFMMKALTDASTLDFYSHLISGETSSIYSLLKKQLVFTKGYVTVSSVVNDSILASLE
jgi:hypothetical protein